MLFRNWLSLTGLLLAISSFFALALLLALDLFAHHSNPYMGIIAYVMAPGVLVAGVALMLFGQWLFHRHERRAVPNEKPYALVIDLSRGRDRKGLAIFIASSVLFLLITAIGSNRAYHYTESVTFCGEACHEPMKPEFVTYQHSPHAKIACSECHVGPGATYYIKSKVNGVRQLYCTLTAHYERPIKPPLKHLRPAQETCEQCHWPQRFIGNLDRAYPHFLNDETNSFFAVRLLLKVGGGDPTHGPVGGIHWHMNLANKIEYISSVDSKLDIPWVRLTDASGHVAEYRTPDFKDDPAKYPKRVMDCMDCHNRPAHHFRSPNDATDLAMASGLIDRSLPWIKSNVVSALISSYGSETEALTSIERKLKANYSQTPQITSLVSAVQRIYQENFFPVMHADWRSYPNNIGHKDWPGCFRCHDGKHKTADGLQTIKASDCNACHVILAQGNGSQLEQLHPEGQPFFHVDSDYSGFSCTECHTGAFPKE